MANFARESVAEALERSLRNAKNLRAKDAAAVAAARALAWRIDNWNDLAQIALIEAETDGGRPKLPQNDNVSLGSFLKYLDALGLTPMMQSGKRQSEGETEGKGVAKRQKSSFEQYREMFA